MTTTRVLIARHLLALLCCVVCLIAAPAVHAAGPNDALMHVEFDDRGLSSFQSLGKTLVAPEDRRVWIFGVSYRTPEGKIDSRYSHKSLGSQFDHATRTLTISIEGLTVIIRYEPTDTQLGCQVTLRNTDPVAPLVGWEIAPIYLRLPRLQVNQNLQVLALGSVAEHEQGTLGLMNLSPDYRLFLRQDFTLNTGAVPLFIAPPNSRVSKHPVVNNDYFSIPPAPPIQPGQERSFRFVIKPALPKQTITQIFPNYHELTRESASMSLKWSDHRPLGMIFMAHPARNWPTNPRGYNFGRGEKHDVFTEEGLSIFRKELLEYADRNIEILKANNAQGVIVWNLEGEEKHHAISYVGDPRMLPQVSPEMERFADEFMGKFKAAGLKTGLTIRPTEYFNRTPDEPQKRDWWHREVPDPVALMSEKIEYAKKRWGTTIFYLDSNVFGPDWGAFEKNANVPWLMPVEMIRLLHLRHPDVLIIPEWADAQYYRYSAPYGSPNLGEMGTYPATQECIPGAFRAVALGTRLAEEQFDRYVTGVAGGDILMFQSWFTMADQDWTQLIYRQVALQRAVQTPSVPLGWNVAPEEIERYRTALALAARPEGFTTTQIVALLDDASPLVQRATLRSLAQRKRAIDEPIVQKVMAMLAPKKITPASIVLLQPAAEVLGTCGDSAVPGLLKLLENQPSNDAVQRSRMMTLRALSATGTKNPQAHSRIVEILRAQERDWQSVHSAAIATAGKLGIRDAVPVLLEKLTPDNKDEATRVAAIIALGNLREPTAVKPIIEQFDHRWTQIANIYQSARIINTALTQIAGSNVALGKADWLRWMEKNPAATQPAAR